MPAWAHIAVFAGHAEAIGVDSVWVCDHFLSSPPGQPPEGIHEGWTLLSAIAAATSRVEVGSLVMCVSFRNPALLAKMAATLDAVSSGRLVLGLGAGSHVPEFEAFGYATDHRFGRFEEALRIIGPLLRGEKVSFAGRYHQVQEAVLLPAPTDRSRSSSQRRLLGCSAWSRATPTLGTRLGSGRRTNVSVGGWLISTPPSKPKAGIRPHFAGRWG